MKKTVLVVDNDVDFLDTRCDILEAAGYTPLKATSREEAVRLLDERWIHLAIIDVRLRDDNDNKDTSGLTLAKDERYAAVPKIIFTRWPTFEAVREVLGLSEDGLPPAVDFLSKDEGGDAMLAAVRRAFERHVRVNSELVVELNGGDPVTFLQLTGLITPGAGDSMLPRAEELEDLFRRLFYSKHRIRIERLLWQRNARAVVKVFAFSEAKVLEPLVVTCGERGIVVAEARKYRQCAPDATGRVGVTLAETASTTHFSANAYALAGPDAEKAVPLAELYSTAPERAFNAAIDNLFQHSVAEWHSGRKVAATRDAVNRQYRERLGLGDDHGLKAEIGRRIEFAARQGPALGLVLRRDATGLIFKLGSTELSCPDPARVLGEPPDFDQPAVLMNSPGLIDGNNVLADESGQTWFTDFAEAGMAPSPWVFASLEAAIRFDWIKTQRLEWLYELESILVGDDFTRFSVSDLEQPLRRPARAVQSIRRLAIKCVGKNALAYHLGVLYHALARIANFNIEAGLMPQELARLAHALMAAAMIYGHLLERSTTMGASGASEPGGIYIDKSNRAVLVDGRKVSLRSQAYNLLLGLYEHSNQVCSRRQITEQFLGEKYDPADESQVRRLNTAIFRLREKVEDDPHSPRYLLTEPGGGYYLNPQPPPRH